MLSYLKSAAAAVTANITQAAQSAQTVQVGDRSVIIKEQLGEGGFAFVYAVEDAATGQPMAMKRMLCQDKEARDIAEKEIAMLRQLKNHPHIVGYIGSVKKENTQSSHKSLEYFILLELCTGGSLIDLIRRRNGLKLGEVQVCDLFQQICEGVQFMHSQSPPIAHRDLKIENILIDARGQLKICDLGSCCTRSQAYVTQREIVEEEERISKYSTQMYRAPEMADLYRRVLVNEKVDIWALGCILFTLAFFSQPFQDGGNLQILSGSYNVPESHPFSKYLTALIKRLLTCDPIKRPDINQTLALVAQWQTWLKNGGVAKPANSRAASGDVASTASQLSHSATDPNRNRLQRHQSAGEPSSFPASSASSAAASPPEETHSAKSSSKRSKELRREERKVRKASKAIESAAATNNNNDDWANFGDCPAPAPAQAPAPTRITSPTTPSDDSSSDDEAHIAAAKARARVTTAARSPTSAAMKSPRSPVAAPPAARTAELFDSSFFAPAPAPAPSSSTARAPPAPASVSSEWDSFAASSPADDEWAAFSSSSTPVPAGAKKVASAPGHKVASSAPAAATAAAAMEFDEFDFSGFSPSPPPASSSSSSNALRPSSSSSNPATLSPSSATPASARKSRREGKKDAETIDVSKLSISGRRSNSTSQSTSKRSVGGDTDSDSDGGLQKQPRIGKIKLGKTVMQGPQR